MLQGSLSKMDGMESAKGFYGMSPKNNAIFGAIAQSYYFLIGTGAIPARLFLRTNLGERAFSPFAFLLCVLFFVYYGFVPFDEEFIVLGITGLAGSTGAYEMLGGDVLLGNNFDLSMFVTANIVLNPCLWFVIWLIIKGVKHFKSVVMRIKENHQQYSYYRGDGKYFRHRLGGKKWGFDVDERFIRMVIEPLLVLRAGFILFVIGLIAGTCTYYWGKEQIESLGYLLIFLGWTANFGLLTLFSGFCLFLEEYGIMVRIRDAALDLIDGEYDMAFIIKKKEEIQLGKADSEVNIKLVEDIYQSKLNLATMATLPGARTSVEELQSYNKQSMSSKSGLNPELETANQAQANKTNRNRRSLIAFISIGLILVFSIIGYFVLYPSFISNNKTAQSNVKNSNLFTPEDLYELLNYGPDGKAGFLIQKGYVEEAHIGKIYKDWGTDYALFPIGEVGKIIYPINAAAKRVTYYDLVFWTTQKEAYQTFLGQFPEITASFPKEDQTNGTSQHIYENCIIKSCGYERESNGYVVRVTKG